MNTFGGRRPLVPAPTTTPPPKPSNSHLNDNEFPSHTTSELQAPSQYTQFVPHSEPNPHSFRSDTVSDGQMHAAITVERASQNPSAPTRSRKTSKNHIKRPLNRFFIFRLEMQAQYTARYPGANNREVSKMIAKQWKEQPESVKAHFGRLAELAKKKHAEMYPEYRYQPTKGKKSSASTSMDQDAESNSRNANSGTTSPFKMHARMDDEADGSLQHMVSTINSMAIEDFSIPIPLFSPVIDMSASGYTSSVSTRTCESPCDPQSRSSSVFSDTSELESAWPSDTTVDFPNYNGRTARSIQQHDTVGDVDMGENSMLGHLTHSEDDEDAEIRELKRRLQRLQQLKIQRAQRPTCANEPIYKSPKISETPLNQTKSFARTEFSAHSNPDGHAQLLPFAQNSPTVRADARRFRLNEFPYPRSRPRPRPRSNLQKPLLNLASLHAGPPSPLSRSTGRHIEFHNPNLHLQDFHSHSDTVNGPTLTATACTDPFITQSPRSPFGGKIDLLQDRFRRTPVGAFDDDETSEDLEGWTDEPGTNHPEAMFADSERKPEFQNPYEDRIPATGPFPNSPPTNSLPPSLLYAPLDLEAFQFN